MSSVQHTPSGSQIEGEELIDYTESLPLIPIPQKSTFSKFYTLILKLITVIFGPLFLKYNLFFRKNVHQIQ